MILYEELLCNLKQQIGSTPRVYLGLWFCLKQRELYGERTPSPPAPKIKRLSGRFFVVPNFWKGACLNSEVRTLPLCGGLKH